MPLQMLCHIAHRRVASLASVLYRGPAAVARAGSTGGVNTTSLLPGAAAAHAQPPMSGTKPRACCASAAPMSPANAA